MGNSGYHIRRCSAGVLPSSARNATLTRTGSPRSRLACSWGSFVYIWRMRGMSSKRRGKEYAPAVWRLYFDTWGVAPRLFQCPERGNSMKRLLAVICFVVVAVAPILLVTDAWARAGGGSSGGSRGSRSYSSPAKPAPSPMTPSQPSSPASPAPQRPGWGGGLMGGLAGFALGGLLGSMLFGHGMGGGFGGGFGLLEMLLIGGGIFLLVRMFRGRQPQFAPPSGPGVGGPTWQGQSQAYEPP